MLSSPGILPHGDRFGCLSLKLLVHYFVDQLIEILLVVKVAIQIVLKQLVLSLRRKLLLRGPLRNRIHTIFPRFLLVTIARVSLQQKISQQL